MAVALVKFPIKTSAPPPNGRVVVASGVAKERILTSGGVAAPGGVVEERIGSAGGVSGAAHRQVAGIAADEGIPVAEIVNEGNTRLQDVSHCWAGGIPHREIARDVNIWHLMALARAASCEDGMNLVWSENAIVNADLINKTLKPSDIAKRSWYASYIKSRVAGGHDWYPTLAHRDTIQIKRDIVTYVSHCNVIPCSRY
jgi:hypothetical protein